MQLAQTAQTAQPAQTFVNPHGIECVIDAYAPGAFNLAQFRADFPRGGLYGLDTETTALDPRLKYWHPDFRARLVQVATEGYACVLNLADPDQREASRDLLADGTTLFASHSSMDVLTVHRVFGIDISDRNTDTLILGKMASPDVALGGADLKTLATRYGMPGLEAAEASLEARFGELWGEHVDSLRAAAKAEKRSTKGLPTKAWGPEAKAWAWANIPADDPAYLAYAGLDAVVARRLVKLLIPATGAPEPLIRSELWMAGAAARLQIRGYRVDRERLTDQHAVAAAATESANAKVKACTGLDSGQTVKMVAWLGSTGGVNWTAHKHRTKTGAPSLAGKALSSLLNQPGLTDVGMSAVKHLVEVQQHADTLTKLEGVIAALDERGRVHSALNTLEAVTARMSSSGPNMQNFSAGLRGVFIPEEGHVFISGDFDQVELRVAAGLADEPVMKEAILRGDDLHQLTADAIGQPRKVGKTTNFLVVYGGGAAGLASQADIPYELAREVLDRFWSTYRRIAEYNEALKTIRTNIRTFSHRRIPVPVNAKTGEFRSYANLNYMIQSSARDLLARAWWELARVHGKESWVWMLFHDEFVLQVREEEAEEACALLQRCMTMDFMGVPITATAKVLRDEQGVSRWLKD